MTTIRMSVYEADAATLITHLPPMQQPDFAVHLNDLEPGGSFQIPLADALLTTYPNLLDAGNVVKSTVSNAPAMAPVGWVIDTAVPTRTDTGGRSARVWTVSGRGIGAKALSGGVIYPEGGLRSVSGDNRAFDFSSADGPWRITADWGVPEAVRWDLETTHRHGNPIDWIDTDAYFLWSTDPESACAQGRNWFRTEITLAAGANVAVWACGDNVISVRLDGEEIIATDFIDPYAWQKMFSWTGALAAGTHTLAAWCHNTGAGNPAGFICDAATLDVNGIPDILLTRTNAADWTVHTYGPPEPGWPAALIPKVLIEESVARNEMGGAPVTVGYTDTHDSGGVALTDVQSLTLPVSASIYEVLPQIVELGLDIAMAHDFTFSAWQHRGQDLSSSVTLRPGRDIEQNVPSTRAGALVNSALMRHGTGWKLVEDSASITANGRYATGVSTAGSDSDAQATQTADRLFTEQAQEQVTLPFIISSDTPGPKPFLDFNIGDVISVSGVDGLFIPARFIGCDVTQAGPGRVQYDCEFNPNVDSVRSPGARKPGRMVWQATAGLNRAVRGFLSSRAATPRSAPTVPRPKSQQDKHVFSHAGAADTTMSGPSPVTAAVPLRSVTIAAGTAASSSSVATVYVNGSSVGTVTLPTGDTLATAFFSAASAPANSVITAAMTTVGTGLADITITVDTSRL